MKKYIILPLLFFFELGIAQTNTFPSSGNVGIGTTSPSKSLDIIGDGINLESTTSANQHGIIFKNGNRFISDFNYGNNGTVTTAGLNLFVGINAGNLTMGSTATSYSQSSYNTAIGYESFMSNTVGYGNSAVGFYSLKANNSGIASTSVGAYNLQDNTTGNFNTSIGFEGLTYNTTGYNNTALGFESLRNNTTGIYNTATGSESLLSNSTGNDNTATGRQALYDNTSGYENVGSGGYTLLRNTTGFENTADGFGSMYFNTTGRANCSVGYASLQENSTGNFNVGIGYEAGLYESDGTTGDSASSYSVFIGPSTRSLSVSDENEIVIGYNTTGAGSNSVVLGNSSISKTLLQGNVLIGKTSQTNSSYKLDVNGNIRANKLVVNTSGADYVFDSTYHLPSIDSLAKYVSDNKHLPDIPSAKQMQKLGIDIGTNQAKLLEKIEEQTLYIIELNKKLCSEDNAIKELKNEVTQLEKKQNKK